MFLPKNTIILELELQNTIFENTNIQTLTVRKDIWQQEFIEGMTIKFIE
jgi:hypothetical protein